LQGSDANTANSAGKRLAWPATALAATDEAAVRVALLARLAKLQNVSAECDVSQFYGPPGSVMQTNVKPVPGSNGVALGAAWAGPRDFSAVFWFLNGKARYAELAGQNDPLDIDSLFVRNYEPHRFEQLEYRKGETTPYGMILDSFRLPTNDSDIDIAIGLRLPDGNHWMSPEDIAKPQFAFPDDDRVVGSLSSAADPRETHLLTFSRKLGYALVTLEIVADHNLAQSYYTITNDQFRDVGGGLMLPFHLKQLEQHWQDNAATNGLSADTTVKGYKVGDPGNNDSVYTMVWPLNTIVGDQRTGRRFTITDHARTLPDTEIAPDLQAPTTRP
jgi:hypothetical protein